ncbi:thioesterase [Aeromicrobium sp. PE09-221]|uniref:thioesterase family protein n=1 Tax=Aeromicrobium sp. PE09-221 TaxID=1898043 RepID=UPI000B3E7348|nr:hotdog domain-containing protein [Aeromicrobium sp. PE09-221]OUZ11230.1 thioesterase [Aeromicrobium sp. PE09-221]
MATVTHVVTAEHTARAVGSGDLEVLGTPVVIAWLEEAACAVLDLGDRQTSVGTRIEVDHRAPSAVGATITATASLAHQDGRLHRFHVAAHDEHGTLVAAGEIRRIVVDRERFAARIPDVGH